MADKYDKLPGFGHSFDPELGKNLTVPGRFDRREQLKESARHKVNMLPTGQYDYSNLDPEEYQMVMSMPQDESEAFHRNLTYETPSKYPGRTTITPLKRAPINVETGERALMEGEQRLLDLGMSPQHIRNLAERGEDLTQVDFQKGFEPEPSGYDFTPQPQTPSPILPGTPYTETTPREPEPTFEVDLDAGRMLTPEESAATFGTPTDFTPQEQPPSPLVQPGDEVAPAATPTEGELAEADAAREALDPPAPAAVEPPAPAPSGVPEEDDRRQRLMDWLMQRREDPSKPWRQLQRGLGRFGEAMYSAASGRPLGSDFFRPDVMEDETTQFYKEAIAKGQLADAAKKLGLTEEGTGVSPLSAAYAAEFPQHASKFLAMDPKEAHKYATFLRRKGESGKRDARHEAKLNLAKKKHRDRQELMREKYYAKEYREDLELHDKVMKVYSDNQNLTTIFEELDSVSGKATNDPKVMKANLSDKTSIVNNIAQGKLNLLRRAIMSDDQKKVQQLITWLGTEERARLFGASLTGSEKAAFEDLIQRGTFDDPDDAIHFVFLLKKAAYNRMHNQTRTAIGGIQTPSLRNDLVNYRGGVFSPTYDMYRKSGYKPPQFGPEGAAPAATNVRKPIKYATVQGKRYAIYAVDENGTPTDYEEIR